jgi:CHRD domain/FG-GAP-like repeat
MNKKFKSLLVAAIFTIALSGAVKAETFYAYLNSAQEVPANASTATGYARVVLNESAGTIAFTVVFNNLSSNQAASHIHAPSAIGVNSPVVINFGAVGGTSGTITGTAAITPTQISQLRAHLGYVNVHSANFPGGEIRGQLGNRRPVDYDGDGRTDYSVLRFPNVAPPGVAQATFYNQNSTSGFQAAQWGDANTDFPAPGDYDGDGRDDLALYRAGATAGSTSAFLILRSSDNTALLSTWGLNGDAPVARDYDGDGKTDVAVFREGATVGSQATWLILQSSNSAGRIVPWGTTGASDNSTGDTPVPADYDGDGKFDLAVYRFGGLAPNNSFIVLRSSDSTATYQQWGNFTTDYILPGDYDGDGKADLCAARTGATASTQVIWYILQSSNNQLRALPFGITSDLPVQGDYDGDARTDLAVYRRGATTTANSTFWVYNSLSNTAQATLWGLQPDFPIATFDAR